MALTETPIHTPFKQLMSKNIHVSRFLFELWQASTEWKNAQCLFAFHSSICIKGYGVFIAERPAWSVIVKTELFPSWCSL